MKFNYRHQSIQFKLILYFAVIAAILLFVGVLSYFINARNADSVSSVLVDYVYLNDLDSDMKDFNKSIKSYLLNKSSDSLMEYYRLSDQITTAKNKLSMDRSYTVTAKLERNMYFMLDYYLKASDLAIEAKRGRNTDNYRLHYEKMQKLSRYVESSIDELLSTKLIEGSDRYDASKKTAYLVNLMSLCFTAVTLLVGLALSTKMVLSITKPLIELSKNAERVSNGDFNVQPLDIHTEDEIEILSHSFDEMLKFIKGHIDDIRRESELESKLNEQRVQNLNMVTLLKEAELKSLQSQINPHFLYNTLNAATQLSMIEGAERTSEFVQKIALYFRYMLRQLNATVTVREELENVETYMYILKTRFGERIHYETEIDTSLLDVAIPSTVIQPVVENAYMHGLEDMETEGTIVLSLFAKQDYCVLEIRDNGRGMRADQIQSLLVDRTNADVTTSSGIGIKNVAERLRLFYNREHLSDVFEVESTVGIGTVVRLKLYQEGEHNHA